MHRDCDPSGAVYPSDCLGEIRVARLYPAFGIIHSPGAEFCIARDMAGSSLNSGIGLMCDEVEVEFGTRSGVNC